MRQALIALLLTIGVTFTPMYKAEVEEGKYERYSAYDQYKLEQMCKDLWTNDSNSSQVNISQEIMRAD